ncbi:MULTISPECIES: FAD-dependent oxidoreductase [unclassified Mycobacterium]|uniref:FAD-dependent oxidoreductase n=1 Tax=unclassified Mycobacterium TaxID=2642494 RepID=UPI0029C874DC|nr:MULTISPECIES: FAD-dependent oxidoreductase [unclassified Mycobacterium]
MTNAERLPVLIVGAGPTGLTAAIELSRLGVDVRIVDKALEASSTSRALGVQARTVELLRPRGVGNELLRLGNRASATTLYADGQRLAGIELHRMASEYNFILMLAQSETERLLAERLGDQGVTVERGVEFESLAQHEDMVQVVLRHSDGGRETLRASYVIAADGSHSPIRKALGLPFVGRSLTQSYVLGDVHVAGDVAEDQLSIFLASNGFLAIFPMGDGRFRFMATDPDGVTGDTPEPSLDDIQRLYDRTAHIDARLYELNWSSRFRINSRHMTSLRDRRVFFGGDAAHVHSPAGGQGMNAGIQDMINLSWKLAMVLHGSARPELLDTYETDRLPVIRQLVAMTERATKVFNSTSPGVHALLTRLAPKLLSRSRIQNKAAPRLGQLSASYRDQPLSAGGGRIGGLHAGDRVSDVHLAEGRLYDLLDMATLTLFVMGDSERFAPAYRDWDDVIAVRHIAVAPELGPGPAWLLVRPDGYLAAAGGLDGGARLSRWLDRWLIATQHPKASSAALVSGSARPNSSSIRAHSAVAATHSLAD